MSLLTKKKAPTAVAPPKGYTVDAPPKGFTIDK